MDLTVEQLKYLERTLLDKWGEHDEQAEFEESKLCRDVMLKVQDELIEKMEEE